VLQLGHFNSPLKAHHWKEKLNWYFAVSPEVTHITSVYGPLANSRCMASPTSRSSVEYWWRLEISRKNFPCLIFGILKEFIQFFPSPQSMIFKHTVLLGMKRQNDRILKEKLPSSVGAQYATGDQWRNNSRKNEGIIKQRRETCICNVRLSCSAVNLQLSQHC